MEGEILPLMYEAMPFPTVQYAENQPVWNMRGQHYHNGYELQLFLEGDRRFFVNDKPYILRSGELFVLAPYTVHYSERFKSEKMTRYMIALPLDMFDICLNERETEYITAPIKTCIIPLDIHQLEHIKKLAAETMRYNKSLIPVSGKIGLYYNIIIAEYVRELMPFAREIIPDPSGVRKEVMKALEYMHNNVSNSELKIGDAAAFVHMSSSRFNDVFKAYTGRTFIKYMNKFRCEKIMKQLTATSVPLPELAEQYGFSSTAHLTRIFREEYGMPPSEFRKRYQRN